MVRLVFRPYTQIRRSICTSESLRASTRVSSGFTLFRHSSPSFGSQQLCSYSNPSEDIRIGRWCTLKGSHLRSLSLRVWVWHPNTRIDVRLLGPCFKTGRLKPLCQHPKHIRDLTDPGLAACWVPQSQLLHAAKGYTPGDVKILTFIQQSKLMLTRKTRKFTLQINARVDFWPTRLASSVSLSTISRTV